ncbi:MAG: hypothetical protein ABIH70_10205 [Chloroflexota bacterium]
MKNMPERAGRRPNLLTVPITIILILTFLAGCTKAPAQPLPIPPSSVNFGDEPAPPYTLELSFPNGAPALNQVAELKGVIKNKNVEMVGVNILASLPEGFELISGNISWSANSLPYGDTEVISAQLKAIKTGNWTIEVRLNEGNSVGYPEGGARHPIYVSVQENSAEWGVYPPWLKNNSPTTPVQRTD